MKIKNWFLRNWILIVILVFASLLRLWNIGNIPPSLTQDEASLGYNAYSILVTGKDEYGKVFPIIFKSFGDYKPGLYVYLDVPFVATMGLNEVSVRLPSAVAGILSVFLIYLIIKQLFNSLETGKWKLEIVAAFVAATNPWLIYYSRGAWEANVSLTLTLAAIYFFLRILRSPKYLVLSISLFALSLWTYQGAKLSSAIVVLVLGILYRKELFRIGKKYLYGTVGVGILISLPIIISLFNGQTGRLDVFSIFSYPRPQEYTQTFLNEDGEKIGSLSYYLYHSEALNFTRGILGRYFNHFSGKFLFFQGDYQNPQHSAPYQGMLLISDIVLLIFGLIFIVRKGFNKSVIFIFLWLILSPLPAVLTRDQVQSVRAINMAAPLVMVLSLGLYEIIKWLDGRMAKWLVVLFILAFYLLPFTYFVDAYFIHVPAHNSQYWNYGYKQVVNEISSLSSDGQKMIVEQSYAQPYIYFLFFQKYDPVKYQDQAKLTKTDNASDVGLVGKLDNIQFSQIDWSQVRNKHGVFVVVDGVTPIPDDLKYDEISKIYFLNGRDLAFEIVKIK